MSKQLKFADIPVGDYFHMDFAAQSDVKFFKVSDVLCRVRKLNALGELTMQAKPGWEVKTVEQFNVEQEARSNFQRQKEVLERSPVRGHSSTYPYGEH